MAQQIDHGDRTPRWKSNRPHRNRPVDQEWVKVKVDWYELNPPEDGDYYQCALCPYYVHKDEVTLDHILTRSSRPDLKYKLDNLQPAHWYCNRLRGSMSMENWNKQRFKG